MVVVAALGEKLGEHDLQNFRGRQRVDELEQLDLGQIPAWRNPADAQPRRERLRERRAEHDAAVLLERLQRQRTRRLEMQIAVDVVLDHRNAARLERGHQRALALVGHDAAERIADVAHQNDRLQIVVMERHVERLE
jgi:hypothetical protein